jgi:hypothetical protein
MPRISEFFGIAIYMYFREHNPPHFHAIYSGQEVQVAIDTLAVLSGEIQPRAMGLVIEWAGIHRAELLDDWEKARNNQPLENIRPLG